jgi:hypothetical protein
LHQTNFSLNPPQKGLPEQYTSFSFLALRSLTRAVIEIVRNALLENEKTPKLVTPLTLYTFASVADFHFQIGANPGCEEEWRNEAEDLKRFRELAGMKWKLAM